MIYSGFEEVPVDYVELISRREGLSRDFIASRSRVAIIGAGAAGLAAAYELARVGIEPIVYEISDRIGGRLYSYRFPGDPHAIAELGAMRFPSTAHVFFHYLKAFELRTQTFPDPLVVPTVLYFKGHRHLCLNKEDLPSPLQRVAQKWTALVDLLIPKEQRDCTDPEIYRAFWQEQIDQYANVTFYQALISHGWDSGEIDLFGSLGLGTGGFDSLYSVSFLEFLRILRHRWERDQQLVEGGAEQIAAQLWKNRRDCRHFGSISVSDINNGRWRPGVRAISLDRQQIRICDCSGAEDRFDAAILTCALPAIETGIAVGPGIFSPEVTKAIRSSHHVRSSKIFVRTREAFWKNNPCFPRCAITDEVTRGTYLFDFENTKSGVVCLSYTWEDASQKFLSLKPEQQVDVCLEAIERILGAEYFRSRIEEVITISWEQMPHYHGAFKLAYPGQYAEETGLFLQNRAAVPTEDRGVYLAGDGVSFSGGWVEGALQTGIQAAISAISRCRTLAANGKRGTF
jgi:monoamine oxidase